MTLHLYNTLTRRRELFETLEEGRARMYVCGPTVYADAHIGHAMSAIVFDMIRRYLEYLGYEVTYVTNFTDVDDKIIIRAQETGRDPFELAQYFTDKYLRHLSDLNIKPADTYPRVTSEISNIVRAIEELGETDFAYAVDGSVYFRVNRDDDYGKLSRRRQEDAVTGTRVEGEEGKENDADFALWKGAKEGEPSWESPWGPGRPGWHIECVAMSLGLLGDGFDIHGGGSDLIFPHHENERAEAEAAGHRFARLWMHSAMVNVEGEKMAKSAGNFRTLADVLAVHDPRALRLAMLQAHYRSTMEIDDAVLASAAAGIERLDAFARRVGALGEVDVPPQTAPTEAARAAFAEAMDNDMGTPGAVAAIFELLRKGNIALDAGETETAAAALATVRDLASALGLHLQDSSPDEAIQRRVDERQAARAARDYATADRIRTELTGEGIELEDTPGGTIWRRVN